MESPNFDIPPTLILNHIMVLLLQPTRFKFEMRGRFIIVDPNRRKIEQWSNPLTLLTHYMYLFTFLIKFLFNRNLSNLFEIPSIPIILFLKVGVILTSSTSMKHACSKLYLKNSPNLSTLVKGYQILGPFQVKFRYPPTITNSHFKRLRVKIIS